MAWVIHCSKWTPFKVSNIHSTLWSCWVLVGIEAITFQVYLLRMKQSFILKSSCSYILISCHTLLPVAVVKICLSSLPWIHWTSSAQLDLWCASSRCSGTYFLVPASPGWKALKSHRSPLLDLGKSWDTRNRSPWELSTWKWMNSELDLIFFICASSGCLTHRSLAKTLKVHQRTCWQPLWADSLPEFLLSKQIEEKNIQASKAKSVREPKDCHKIPFYISIPRQQLMSGYHGMQVSHLPPKPGPEMRNLPKIWFCPPSHPQASSVQSSNTGGTEFVSD